MWIWDADKEGGAGWKDGAGLGSVISVNNMTGEVILTKSNIGLGNVDNTADANKSVASATKLATARTIGVSGVTGTAQSFDGTNDIIIPITAVPATLLTNKLSIKGSEITDDKHWVPSNDASVTNFVAMSTADFILNSDNLATGTVIAVTDGDNGYITTQATSLVCDLPLDL